MQVVVTLIKDLHYTTSQMNNFPTNDFNIHSPDFFFRAGWTHTKWNAQVRSGSIMSCIHFFKECWRHFSCCVLLVF